MTSSSFSLFLAAVLLLTACGDDSGSKSSSDNDNSSDDQTSDDSATGDDDSTVDATVRDAGKSADAGKGSLDAGRKDAGDSGAPSDAGLRADAAPLDAGTPDASTSDASTIDASAVDASSGDSGSGAAAEGGTVNTQPGYMNLAPPLGIALDPDKPSSVTPPPPSGWKWYDIDGAICRDGSQNGIYVRFTSSDKLLIYLEGGGACSSPGFCDYNPANVNEVIGNSGDVNGAGETLLTSSLDMSRQQPGVEGIFDVKNAANPFADWNMVYIPYCTGDTHFGTKTNVQVPGVSKPQQFVGYFNMQKFVARIVPTFQDSVKRVVLAGSSAGGFGVTLNFSMFQDAFGDVPVVAIDDSGPSFSDNHLPVCLQKHWRELWGFDDALPPDCMACLHSDGGGLINLAAFLAMKHPNSRIGLVSSTEDEVIRAFFSSGLHDCSNFENASPVSAALAPLLGETFPAADYAAGLTDLRDAFSKTKRFATYYMGSDNVKDLHQHLWRPRFYQKAAGSSTIADWVASFLEGDMLQVGP